MKTTPATTEYFAVPDPLDRDRITYWRRTPRTALRPWPPKAKYHPLYRNDMIGLSDEEAHVAAINYYGYLDRAVGEVAATIEADPITTAARFARMTNRCCCCARVLTDNQSKLYGIGPDCRTGMPPTMLAALVEVTGRAHADAVNA